jgi:acetylornithine/N-succinyldiaminopimelate aminotransferase
LAKEDVAAVMVEGIQGIGGIYVPEPAFLEEAQSLCHAYGAVLILDEIQSGYGRSGKFFAFQYADIAPDLITVAKGMGNGFPIGGVLIHPRHEPSYGLLGTTFGGNHLACAAGIAVLEVIEEEGLLAHAQEVGQYLLDVLPSLPGVVEVRGRGLMIGLELGQPAAPLRKQLLFAEGVFTGSAANANTIRLLPPLNIKPAQAEYLVDKLRKVLGVSLDANP